MKFVITDSRYYYSKTIQIPIRQHFDHALLAKLDPGAKKRVEDPINLEYYRVNLFIGLIDRQTVLTVF